MLVELVVPIGAEADGLTPALHRLKCAETWAGNERIASLVELPGLTRGYTPSQSDRGDRRRRALFVRLPELHRVSCRACGCE